MLHKSDSPSATSAKGSAFKRKAAFLFPTFNSSLIACIFNALFCIIRIMILHRHNSMRMPNSLLQLRSVEGDYLFSSLVAQLQRLGDNLKHFRHRLFFKGRIQMIHLFRRAF